MHVYIHNNYYDDRSVQCSLHNSILNNLLSATCWGEFGKSQNGNTDIMLVL